MSLYRQLIALQRPHKWWIILSILLGTLTISASVGLMASSGYLLSWAAIQPPILDMILVIVAVRFFGISRGVLRYLERLISHETTFRILASIRVRFFKKISNLSAIITDGFRASDLLSNITSDVEELQNFYLRVVAPSIVACITSIAAFIFLFFFSSAAAWTLIFFLFISGVLLPLTTTYMSTGLGDKQLKLNQGARFFWIEQLQGMEEIRLFNLAHKRREESHQLFREQLSNERKQAIISSFQESANLILVFGGVAALFFFVHPDILSGELARIHLAMVIFSFIVSFEATQNLGSAYQYVDHTNRSAKNLFSVLQIQKEDTKSIFREKSGNSSQSSPIKIQNVTFGYTDSAVIKNISLTLKPGEKKAVIGPSGSGKSTLAHLITGFYAPNQGSIITPPLSEISLIEQNSYIFNDTLRNNLLVASEKATDNEIINALSMASLETWYRSLPQGLDTLLGEFGRNISGGERQRLSIARSVLRNASCWILDEPTANLDTITEKKILKTIEELGSNKTLIWITHRYVNMSFFNEIILLDRGIIRMRGKHTDLLEKDLWYRKSYYLEQDTYN